MAPKGTLDSEAAQRYEDHAVLRQEARRDVLNGSDQGWVDGEGKVTGEDNPASAAADYQVWHNDEINKILRDGATSNPTNHSITMTNPDHAEKALAYDVAIGPCYLSPEEWTDLRKEADWRFSNNLERSNPNKKYADYFLTGKYSDKALTDWANTDSEAVLPDTIHDHRDGATFLEIGGAV
ncbi:hypothetical protein [Burkholderia arboris]|uniref:hypothetical protein n=1 Tax=Burkholderia arboris TaxID=488730 RepID=UPI0030F0F692